MHVSTESISDLQNSIFSSTALELMYVDLLRSLFKDMYYKKKVSKSILEQNKKYCFECKNIG